MSDLLRAFASARSQAPFGSPATMVPPQQQARNPYAPGYPQAPAPEGPSMPSQPEPVWQDYGQQVAPMEAINTQFYSASPFDGSMTDRNPATPPKPAPYAYVGQSRGRN
jgi:hypothetical protein